MTNGKYLGQAASFRRFVRGDSLNLQSGAPVDSVLIFDIDSTIADTKPWFADTILPLSRKLANKFGCDQARVNHLIAALCVKSSLHEYGCVVESIADACPDLNLSPELVSEAAEEFWRSFNAEHFKIQAYPELVKTLHSLRANCPGMAIVALTDAPDFLAPRRLANIGALPFFDGIVAIQNVKPELQNPAYAVCELESLHRMEMEKIGLCDQLMLQASLPHQTAKPSDKGIGLIIEWLNLSADRVIICGDKEGKEGLAAENWHKANPEAKGEITYLRALYGARDVMDEQFVELGKQIPTMAPKPLSDDHGITIHADLNSLAEIVPFVEKKFGSK